MSLIRRFFGIREAEDFDATVETDESEVIRAKETDQHLKRERHELNQTVTRVASGARQMPRLGPLNTMAGAMRMIGEDRD